jgi:hypothetical protein
MTAAALGREFVEMLDDVVVFEHVEMSDDRIIAQ